MPSTIRVDDLGHEYQFHVVRQLITQPALNEFHTMLTTFARGYTMSTAIGAWQPLDGPGPFTEVVLVYRVASLAPSQAAELIEFLLVCSDMKDIYVVHPGGLARGHSLEPVRRSSPAADAIAEALAFRDAGRLHGTRDTGWPHENRDHAMTTRGWDVV